MPAEDEFEDVAGPSEGGPEPEEAVDLAAEVAGVMEVPVGRIAVEPDGDEMAWLVLDGGRVTWFNLRTTTRMKPERRSRFVRALAQLARGIDRLRPMIEGLEVGHRYAVEYRNQEIRRNMRVKGVLRDLSGFRVGKGVSGAGWVLTIETKPLLGTPALFHLDTDVLVDMRPA
ncbi:MAG TPA: hypothetical protein VE646_05575 [Actinomycetota bacterium]|jgi:hypothetical protein|nr:hypothetical protein [Actinomycetota bacterium]